MALAASTSGTASRHSRSNELSEAASSSLFSPPTTPSQTAMAEAGVAALSLFKIPTAYDPSFFNQPDLYAILVHALPSSFTEAGFQAVLVLHPKSDIPPHLGLPTSSRGHEETAFLMNAPKNQPFVMYHQAPRALVMQISALEYLTLLAFIDKEWPRVKSKLSSQLTTMKEGSEPVILASHLSFYGHGSCHYRILLSHRLAFKAKAESRPSRDDEPIKAWLELTHKNDPATSTSTASPSLQEFTVPLQALSTLAQDQSAVKTLTDLVAAYKSRSRKRNKSVA